MGTEPDPPQIIKHGQVQESSSKVSIKTLALKWNYWMRRRSWGAEPTQQQWAQPLRASNAWLLEKPCETEQFAAKLEKRNVKAGLGKC